MIIYRQRRINAKSGLKTFSHSRRTLLENAFRLDNPDKVGIQKTDRITGRVEQNFSEGEIYQSTGQRPVESGTINKIP